MSFILCLSHIRIFLIFVFFPALALIHHFSMPHKLCHVEYYGLFEITLLTERSDRRSSLDVKGCENGIVGISGQMKFWSFVFRSEFRLCVGNGNVP